MPGYTSWVDTRFMGASGEVDEGLLQQLGSTFAKQYDTNQSSLDADTSSGSPTATFTASRGSTTPATTIETQDGNALLFDGVDDIVTATATGLGAGDYYFKCIFNVVKNSSLNGIVSDGGGYGGGIRFSLASASTNDLNLYIDDNSTLVTVTMADATEYNDNDKMEVIVTRASGTLSWSAENITTGITYSDSLANTTDFSSSQPLSLGAWWDQTASAYKDFAAVQIKRLQIGTSADALVLDYDFSDGSGSTLTDIVGSNNGTITGAQWLTDGSTYVTKVTSDDTARWTTGYYAQNGVYTAGPGLLLEGASTNLLIYSEEFDDASWLKGSTGVAAPTVTANQATAPDGSLNADQVDYPAISTATHQTTVYRQMNLGTGHTLSLFLKGDAGGETIYLSTVVNGTSKTTVECSLTTEWKRFEVYADGQNSTFIQFGVDLRGGDTGDSQSAQSAQTIYAWGAQLEDAAYPSSYIPTTTAALTRNAEALTYPVASNFVGGTDGTIALVYRPIMLPDEQSASFKQLFNVGIDGSNYFRYIYGANANDHIRCLTVSGGVSLSANSSAAPFSSSRYSLHSLIGTYSTTADGSSKKINNYIDGVLDGTNANYTVPVGSLPAAMDIQGSSLQSMTLVAVVLFSTRLSASQASDVHDLLT